MSNYRDDTTDTAIASDATWAGLTAIADNTARVKELFILAIAALSINSAVASDELTGSVVTQIQNSAVASDSAFGNLTAKNTILDSVKVSDKFILKQSLIATESTRLTEFWQGAVGSLTTDTAVCRESTSGIMRAISTTADTAIVSDYAASFGKELAIDSALVSDSAIGKSYLKTLVSDSAIISEWVLLEQTAIIADGATARDTLFGTKTVNTLLSETAIASDGSLTLRDMLSSDSAIVLDNAPTHIKGRSLASENAAISDELLGYKQTNSRVLSDSATAFDTVLVGLLAKSLWQDIAVIDDELINTQGGTNAWTANTDTWAMSRYGDLPINRLVVINGKLYGESKDGIYQMDTGTEIVSATIETGKVDFGEALSHPTSAYLEYELNGSASMQVKTTQSGKQQAFTYPLPRERADELTNGRILFGRGLRGRHFTFVLNISATHGYLNSLAINALSTKRRI